jgi:7-cyano-7-deazaguanine synthase in queuosine biosynthesis
MTEHYMIRAGVNEVIISGDVTQRVLLNIDGYFQRFFSLPSPLAQQLLAISAGIYTVDRISKRRMKCTQNGVRQLHLTFQVQDLNFWSNPQVNNVLLDAITFLTDDDWHIEFTPFSDSEQSPRHQNYLDLPKQSFERIALYSGGLDSAAGLAHRVLNENAKKYLLITVGHQSGLHSRVKRQIDDLERIAKDYGLHEMNIAHSTLKTSLKGGKAVRIRNQERSQRSRALLFCATAVSAADVFNMENIEMFENGVGAINLPLMTGMLGSGLATRGAHPTFLRHMSTLASLVLNRKITFELPFYKLTKGEVLRSISSVPGIGEWLQLSNSCIHTSLRVAGISHCGECPACIERRQAFASASIPVKADDYQLNIAKAVPIDLSNKAYFHLYRLDAVKWLDGKQEPRKRLNNHLLITDVPSEEHQRILDLQLRHASEVVSTFGPPYHNPTEFSIESSRTHLLNIGESP